MTVVTHDADRNSGAVEAGILEHLQAAQRAFAGPGGTPRRTFHVKTILAADARLIVRPAIPDGLRAGVFASPREFPAIVRLSSGQSWDQPDWVPDVRGLAVRILDVPFPPVPGGPEGIQDLLAINANVRFPSTPEQFAKLAPLMRSMATVPFRIWRALSPREVWMLGSDFSRIGRLTFTCLSAQSFHGIAPMAMGTGAAKVSFRPRTPQPRRAPLFARHGLRQSLETALLDEDLAWDLCLQPFIDEHTTPIENLWVRWSAAHSPPVDVATLVLKRRDAAAADRLRALVETMSFSPWNATLSHQPLGRIQALRRAAYLASATGRQPRDAAPQSRG